MSEHDYVRHAFEEVIKDATQAEDSEIYVSLYVEVPFYGGPEEGGWWGADVELVSFKKFPSEEAAKATHAKVGELCTSLSKEAKDQYGDHCLRSMDWLDERGLDADYLPEPDGPTKFWVVTEAHLGSQARKDDRYYS